MPVPPTSISAATITSQAMPIEMRMPVRMVGAAAGRMIVKARRKVPTSSVRATSSHSRRTAATPNAVLISIGHSEQIADADPGDRVGELDAEPLVVGAAVVERVFQVLPDFRRHVERTRHGGFA